MQIEVSLPALLSDCTQGRTSLPMEADTLEEAIHRLLEAYPLLRRHLFDEADRLRPHVLLFYNEDSIARMARLDIPLRAGDRLQIVQAVSGG